MKLQTWKSIPLVRLRTLDDTQTNTRPLDLDRVFGSCPTECKHLVVNLFYCLSPLGKGCKNSLIIGLVFLLIKIIPVQHRIWHVYCNLKLNGEDDLLPFR